MDDDDKVRRNLMVVSASVVALTWLNVPEGTIVNRLLGQELVLEGQAWKIWVAMVVILLYFFHRYWSAMGDDSSYAGLKKLSDMHCESLVRKRLDKRIDNLAYKNAKREGWLNTNRRHVFNIPEKKNAVEWTRRDMHDLRFEGSNWFGVIHLTEKPDKYGNLNQFESVNFYVPPYARLFIFIIVFAKLTRSRYFSDLGVPVSLAFIAVSIASYKLGSALIM